METNTKPLSPLPLVLEVGKAYRDAEGVRVQIKHVEANGEFVGLRDGQVRRWRRDGEYCGVNGAPDLVSLWGSPPPLVVDAEGWIEWKGGECPFAEHTQAWIRFRSGREHRSKAPYYMRWGHIGTDGDIIAYKLSPIAAEPASKPVRAAHRGGTNAADVMDVRVFIDPSAVRDAKATPSPAPQPKVAAVESPPPLPVAPWSGFTYPDLPAALRWPGGAK